MKTRRISSKQSSSNKNSHSLKNITSKRPQQRGGGGSMTTSSHVCMSVYNRLESGAYNKLHTNKNTHSECKANTLAIDWFAIFNRVLNMTISKTAITAPVTPLKRKLS